jgi:hypothetical protein
MRESPRLSGASSVCCRFHSPASSFAGHTEVIRYGAPNRNPRSFALGFRRNVRLFNSTHRRGAWQGASVAERIQCGKEAFSKALGASLALSVLRAPPLTGQKVRLEQQRVLFISRE